MDTRSKTVDAANTTYARTYEWVARFPSRSEQEHVRQIVLDYPGMSVFRSVIGIPNIGANIASSSW
jgi:hypothetical protein